MMKRLLSFTLAFLLLCSTALAETYRRDAAWPATFDYEVLEGDGFRLGYTTDKADTEAFAAKLTDRMQSLRRLFPDVPDAEVYLLANSPKDVSMGSGRKLFLRADDAEDVQLLCLVQSLVSMRWAAEGIAALLRDDQPDAAAVSAFLSNDPDSHVTTLLPFYFDETWATEAERQAAKALAQACASVALEKNDLSLFDADVTADVMAEACARLGVDAAFSDLFADAAVTWEQESAAVWHMVYASGDYTLQQVAGKFDSAESLYSVLCDQKFTLDTLVPLLLDVPDYLDLIGDPYRTIYFSLQPASFDRGIAWGGLTFCDTRKIQLSTFASSHEICHMLVQAQENTPNRACEGIADYLSNVVVGNTPYKRQELYEALNTSDNDELMQELIPLYQKVGGEMTSPEAVDPLAFLQARALLPLIDPEVQPLTIAQAYESPRYSEKGKQGSELTYRQAAAFLAWLRERTDFDTVILFSLGQVNFTDAFGAPYPMLKKQWMKELKEAAGL